MNIVYSNSRLRVTHKITCRMTQVHNGDGEELVFGSLAQLGEHLPYKQGVTGSIPVTPTKMAR